MTLIRAGLSLTNGPQWETVYPDESWQVIVFVSSLQLQLCVVKQWKISSFYWNKLFTRSSQYLLSTVSYLVSIVTVYTKPPQSNTSEPLHSNKVPCDIISSLDLVIPHSRYYYMGLLPPAWCRHHANHLVYNLLFDWNPPFTYQTGLELPRHQSVVLLDYWPGMLAGARVSQSNIWTPWNSQSSNPLYNILQGRN